MEEEKKNNEIAGNEGSDPESMPEQKPEEGQNLQQLLEAKELENKGLQDRYLRTYAEFENYKKRVAKDHEALTKYANERLLNELLPVVDNLDRAILHTQNIKDSTALKILEGLELVLKQFKDILGRFGVTAFESFMEAFDPNKHQAVEHRESDRYEEGTVIDEIQKGYMLNDRVLRPALVVVAKNTASGKNQDGQT